MKFSQVIFLLCFTPNTVIAAVQAKQDYREYHNQIVKAEKLIGDEKFRDALSTYDQVFKTYHFIFSRDYKIAAQLALYLHDRQKGFQYIKRGIAAGWELKELKENKFLSPLHDDPEWKSIEGKYDSLHSQYLTRIDHIRREKVHLMFKKDQRKALGALFRIGDKAQERYAIRKFAPHSEIQIKDLIIILDRQGYPGEQLIGNDFWMSTILSHHNSITQEYVKKDTLYNFIKPMLIQAIEKGQMSPYEFALIDDWQKAVSSDRTEPGYGFLNSPEHSTLSRTNELRQAIGLRPVESRNKLVDVESATGMNFYLPDWVNGKIVIMQK